MALVCERRMNQQTPFFLLSTKWKARKEMRLVTFNTRLTQCPNGRRKGGEPFWLPTESTCTSCTSKKESNSGIDSGVIDRNCTNLEEEREDAKSVVFF